MASKKVQRTIAYEEKEFEKMANLMIELANFKKLIKKIFIFTYTRCWTDRHPQIIDGLK